MSDNDMIRRGDAIAHMESAIVALKIIEANSEAIYAVLGCLNALRALPAVQVGVKPLEWVDADEGMCTKWRAAALGGRYELVALDKEDGLLSVNFCWGRPLSFWFIQGEPNEYGPTGPRKFPTLEAAKAAAQADYEARIRSALTVQPSPDVAALVEAFEHLLNNYLLDEHDEPELCVDDEHWSAIHDAFAALARVKGGEA